MIGGAQLPDDATVVFPDKIPDLSGVEASVGGVLLAGGMSSRFGSKNKLLAPLDEQPVVCHAATTLVEADLDEVVAVLGYEADAVARAIANLDVSTVSNEDYRGGQSTSVQSGAVEAIQRGWDAAVFLPGDVPLVASSTVDSLVDAYASSERAIVVASYDGSRGNPVMFDKAMFELLCDVSGDTGGRSLFDDHDDTIFVDVDDDGVVIDVDTEDDLQKLRNTRM